RLSGIGKPGEPPRAEGARAATSRAVANRRPPATRTIKQPQPQRGACKNVHTGASSTWNHIVTAPETRQREPKFDAAEGLAHWGDHAYPLREIAYSPQGSSALPARRCHNGVTPRALAGYKPDLLDAFGLWMGHTGAACVPKAASTAKAQPVTRP